MGEKNQDQQKLTESLIKELIWARYIKNDSLPKEKIIELSSISKKYLKLFTLLDLKFKEKEVEDNLSWFIGVFSSEVEEIIDSNIFLKESLNYEVFSWFRGGLFGKGTT